MNEIILLLGLVLGLAVIQSLITDTLGIRVPAAVGKVFPLALGIGLAYGLDYSIFAAFGQSLRAEWLHPLMTGVVLVAFGEFVRTLVSAITNRSDAPVVSGQAIKVS